MNIESIEASAYRFPTPEPEADGTLQWDATTAVVVTAVAGGVVGLGWTYSTPAAAAIVAAELADVVTGRDSDDVAACFEAMRRACRNFGTQGLVMQAISAVDIALWDLKARTRGIPLTALFGEVRESVPVYGSGGFTSMSDEQLSEQIAGWREAGCTAMKIKVAESWGARIVRDLARVRQLRDEAGDGVELMVDANGGYTVAQARRVGAELDRLGVVWFEEPVSSDDVAGLATVRAALGCDVTAGEYVADAYDAERLAPVVDCLQLDATRCGGYTGFLWCAGVAAAYHRQVSAHCAPALHAPVAAAVANLRHVEWFADHARLEPLLVDGAPTVLDGALQPNRTTGHGLVLRPDASQWQIDKER